MVKLLFFDEKILHTYLKKLRVSLIWENKANVY